ncbi:MFS transporter [Kitasatospora sp. HPMI-4]|uniref:MFS transporter n=1 Tax=Kitasatospora sp. HPMI-4 TaxID=3448443 RepID=UPI003F1E17D7
MKDPTVRRRTTALAALCIAMFMTMLDNVIVNNALPRIGQQLHAGVSGLQWVVEGYSLVYAGLLLTGGTLGDRYGRARIFLAGLAVFTAGSAMAGLSWSIGLLTAARMVQGIGAALLTPGSLSIIGHLFTGERERARAIGLWSGVSALGLAIGPVLGGPLVEAFGWTGVFWVNVPVGLVGLVVAARSLPRIATTARRLDLPGLVLSGAGLGGLVYALVEGPNRGWTDTRVITCAALAAAALLAFVLVELRTAEPMLDLRLFRDRVFSGAVTGGFMVSFGMFGTSFFLPLLMQGVMGWSPSDAGLAGLPMTAMIVVASPLAGTLASRLGPRIPLVTGLALCAVALGGLSCYGARAHYTQYLWVLFTMGFGMGMTFTPVSVAVLRRVAPQQTGMASATINTLRELGGVVGVAALGAVLTGRLTANLAGALDRLGVPSDAGRRLADSVTSAGATGAERPAGLPPAVHDAVTGAFVDGLHFAMRCGAGAIALAAVLVAVLLSGDRPAGARLGEVPPGTGGQRPEPVRGLIRG